MQRLMLVALIAAVCGCRDDAAVVQPRAEQAALPDDARYDVTRYGASLGGNSRGDAIDNGGLVAGWSNLAGDHVRHAVLWRRGSLVDLGTLGGPNSNVQWPGVNQHGVAVGISQTATPDPLHEDWSCSAFFPADSASGKVCLGFVWQNGAMRGLPTLGGTNGFATGINNRGQVVGWAETPVHDPTCNAPQVLQFRAVLWQPGRAPARELPPFPGDSTSAATAINDAGQAVGISGECDVAVGRFSARHAVLWDHGRVIDIGNLGGVAWHTPMDINDSGDVVGFSDPPGDEDGSFIAHAFLWTREAGMQDLGVLTGDDISEALAVNNARQVVGVSCGAVCRAFIWQDGVMTDLNTMLASDPGGLLVSGRDISAAGLITGDLADAASGRTVMYVARPAAGP